MNLHPRELQMVAGLSDDPAFQLLLSKLAANIDELTEDLRFANPLDTPDLLAYWRAYKSIYADLLLTPQVTAKTLKDEEKEQPVIENDPKVNAYLGQFYREAQKAEEDKWAAEE